VENVEIPKDRVLLTLRDRDDLMSSWSLSSAPDFPVPDMPVTRILLIIRRLGKASCALPLWATSIGADGCSTLLVPPGDAKDEGLGRRRTRCGSRPALAPARYFKPLRAETS
jgi:hypothetical protein